MRKKFFKVTKAFISSLLIFSIIFTLLISDNVLAYINQFGSTNITYNEEREIAKGVVLNNWQGKNPDGTPKLGHTITFHPATSDAMVVAAFGNSVNSRVTLSSTSYIEEQKGVSIIGGINGDFYHLANGIPIGLVIRDGRLVSNSSTKWNAIGFKADGSVVIGSPNIEMKVTLGNTDYPFVNFNKAQGDWGPYLYSSDFGPNTGSTVPSLEVVMDINMGELAPGKLLIATVKEIRKDVMATPIGPNQLVFSARNGKQGQYALSQFKQGDVLTIQFHDTTGEWVDVKQAIGGETILINNGVIASGLSTKNYNPTTAVGVKANGEVVFFQVDGRTGSSQGVSSMETAQFLYNMGCVKALQLDGGGSSEIIARMPGYRSPTMINVPSDGSERANSNALLLVSKKSLEIRDGIYQVNPVAQKLHIYPTKAYALPNSTLQYTALATDEYYFPTPIPGDFGWWSAAGQMDATGKLTVSAAPGTYQVLGAGGSVIGQSEVTVLSSITSLQPSQSTVTVSPGASVDLSCQAYYQGVKVASTDRSFTWKVEGNIGTITPDGVFTMAQGAQGSGKIIISYGNVSATVNVVAAASPDSIEDFENGTVWGSSTVRAKSGSVSIVKDAKLAKSGSGLLKVDYDFTLATGVEKGVAGIYAFRIDPKTKAQTVITLNNNPTAIGMWVYGDNSKNWLRAKVKDGSGQSFDIDFTPEYRADTKTGGIDWTGWKYVEAPIPAGRKGPFVLETPVRIMCSRDEMRTKGTIYIDQIRAVYGVSTKDSVAPVAKVISPVDKFVSNVSKVPLNIELTDSGSGVDPKSIQVLLDGAEVQNISVTGNGTVAVKGELGADNPLADGLHNLVINYADVMGNRGSTKVSFTVETGAPQLVGTTTPLISAASNTAVTTISVKNPKTLRKIYVTFSYDPNLLEVVDADPITPGKQINLEGWVKKGKIMTHNVDEANGRITIQVDGLANLSTSAQATFGAITFKARNVTQNASTSVQLHFGAMLSGNVQKSQWFGMPSMPVEIDYSLTLAAAGTSYGELTTFTVTDKAGNPVEGAKIYVNDMKDPLWTTDKSGKAQTMEVTKFPVGISFNIKAKKGDYESNTITLTITEKSK